MARQSTQARRSLLSEVSRCHLSVSAFLKSLCTMPASFMCIHFLNSFIGTGYASNPATPSRGTVVSAAHAHQSQHLSAPGFAAPQAMLQAPQIAAPTSSAEYEALRNQAHEAYRGGDFHRALQLCQSVSSGCSVQRHCPLPLLRLSISCKACLIQNVLIDKAWSSAPAAFIHPMQSLP